MQLKIIVLLIGGESSSTADNGIAIKVEKAQYPENDGIAIGTRSNASAD